MPSLSPFQLLPPHVVELVVQYSIDYVPPLFLVVNYNGDNNAERLLLQQMPFLWVCRNFREVVYSRYCKVCELTLCDRPKRVASTWRSWPECLREHVRPAYSQVKELYIKVDPWTIFNGRLLEYLSREPYCGCLFPRVRSIELRFEPDPLLMDSSIRASTFRANINEFVNRLFNMVPAANKARITGCNFDIFMSRLARSYFIQLVLKLCQSFKHIEYDISDCDVKLTSQQIDTIRDLVQLNYHIDKDCEQCFQIARQSAPTLQTLVLYFSTVNDISGLIQNTDGSYVEYPWLHTLELHNDDSLDMSYFESMGFNRTEQDIAKLPVFVGAIPFPMLRRLCIQMDYPFGDDTLFRGNAETLEFLDLELYNTLIDRVYKYKVFTPDSHPNLWCVKICQIIDYEVPNFPTVDEYVRFALSIGPRARARMIHDFPYDANIDYIPSLFEGFADISTLSLPRMMPLFNDVVSLIKSLPNLSYLCTGPPSFGHMPKGVTVRKLPAYVLSKYGTVSELLRCWHFDKSCYSTDNDIARCVLLLALLCQNLDYMETSYHRNPRFMARMKRMAAMSGFKEHAERFQRLLIKR